MKATATRERARVLSAAQRRTLGALIDHVLPAPGTDDGPGVAEANVLARLEQRLGDSADLRALYAQGIAAIDRVARRRTGHAFAELDAGEQFLVLMRIDRVVERTKWTPGCVVDRAKRRLARLWYQMMPGSRTMGEASRFFSRLVDDVFELFYTASATWNWLHYDGPPMSEGYPELAEPRQDIA